MDEQSIPTPALVIDVVTAKRNIQRMASYAASHGVKLRPHIKTHKSRRMAELQLEAGAIGLTVAKAGEAQIMSQESNDLLVAYPAHDPARTVRLAELARSHSVRVAIDSPYAAEQLSDAALAADATLGVLVDLDSGAHRTGLQTPEQTVRLAERTARQDGLRLDGLFTYMGHVQGSEQQVESGLCKVADVLQGALDAWKKHDLHADIVSGGSTPTAVWSHLVPQLTEIRPGTYVYYDRNCLALGVCSPNDCAARVVATVMSNTVPGKMVLDCGSKSLSSDLLLGQANSGHGLIVEYPGATLEQLTEEHGRVDISQCDRAPKLGERVHVIPNHVCVCVNLQNHVWFKQPDSTLEKVPIDARGLLS